MSNTKITRTSYLLPYEHIVDSVVIDIDMIMLKCVGQIVSVAKVESTVEIDSLKKSSISTFVHCVP